MDLTCGLPVGHEGPCSSRYVDLPDEIVDCDCCVTGGLDPSHLSADGQECIFKLVGNCNGPGMKGPRPERGRQEDDMSERLNEFKVHGDDRVEGHPLTALVPPRTPPTAPAVAAPAARPSPRRT